MDGINVNPDDVRGAGTRVAAACGEACTPGPALTPGTGPDQPMPGREFSHRIVGDLWPQSSASHFRDVAGQLRAGGQLRDELAIHIQGAADGLGAANSGETVDAAVDSHYRQSYRVTDLATRFHDSASAVEAAAGHVSALTEQLGTIDQQANDTIEQIRGSANGGDSETKMAAHNAILSVLGQARGSAETATDGAAAAVTGLSFTTTDAPTSADLRGGTEPAKTPKVKPVSVEMPTTAPTTTQPAATASVGQAASVPVPKPELAALKPGGLPLVTPAEVLARPLPAAAVKGFDTAMTGGARTPAPILAAPMPPPTPLTSPPQTVTAAGPTPQTPITAPPTTPTPGAPVPPPAPQAPAAGPAGALPPFGSDAFRPTLTGAPIPAAPLPSTAPPPTPMPLPPAMPTVGATAVAASLLPDRHLVDARELVNELQHASRDYACIDWCVGVFITPGGPVTVVTSNEGAGYIPAGVYLPYGVAMMWSDPLDDGFRARWFGYANPAATMLAYAEHVITVGTALAALAVSTNDGGAMLRTPYVRECAETNLAAVDQDAPLPELGETHRHRLAVIDPIEYARISTTNMEPGYGGLWTATIRALTHAETRNPIVAHVAAALAIGDDGPTEQDWDELAEFAATARFDASLHRPGRIGADNPDAYRAAFRTARAAELLTYWHTDPPPWADIAYTIHQLGAP